jgi:hypothetical protein
VVSHADMRSAFDLSGQRIPITRAAGFTGAALDVNGGLYMN